MEKEHKFKISVFDKLLLKNGQIINFNTYDYAIIFVNNKTCVCFSEQFKDYVYGMDIPLGKDIFTPMEVVAKVKLKCKLVKK